MTYEDRQRRLTVIRHRITTETSPNTAPHSWPGMCRDLLDEIDLLTAYIDEHNCLDGHDTSPLAAGALPSVRIGDMTPHLAPEPQQQPIAAAGPTRTSRATRKDPAKAKPQGTE
jgi:hypothetical protein